MIKYYIKKHKQMECYIIFKYIHKNNGYAVRGIFRGTRLECENKLKEIKGGNENG